MASLVVWVLLLLADFACSANVSNRISDGEDTSVEAYPSIVQVQFLAGIFWTQNCAGSILTARYVLSAAQCFSGLLYSPWLRRIRAGTSIRNEDGFVSGVVQAINHPNFGQDSMDADITVVELTEPLVYSSVIQQSPIIAAGIALPDNIPVVIAGWGATLEGSSAEVLQRATVLTLNIEECAEAQDDIVTGNMICTHFPIESGRRACSGDAGGPVYYENIVVGVISWGLDCNDDDVPSVSTAVSSYTDWIISVVT